MNFSFNHSNSSFNGNPIILLGINVGNVSQVASSICDAIDSGDEFVSVGHIIKDSEIIYPESLLSSFRRFCAKSDKELSWDNFCSFSKMFTVQDSRGCNANKEDSKSRMRDGNLIDPFQLMRHSYLPILRYSLPMLEEIEDYVTCARVLEHIK